jgi:hypothetical protein
MLRFRILTLTAVLGLAASSAWAQNTLTASESQQGYKLLFDGKTLNGWEQRTTSQPDAKPDWSVQNGTLLCGGTAPSWMHTNDTYADYQLKLQLRGPNLVNSGVFLRSQKEGAPHITGYELQIWDKQPAGYNTGSLVGVVIAPPATLKADVWNDYDVTLKGDRITVKINGKTVLLASDGLHSSGVIGLQCQPEQRIEFRNVKVRTL